MHPNARHDPQGWAEIESAKLAEHIREFQAREISDDVFCALLKCRGFYGDRLRQEFLYQDEVRFLSEKKAKEGKQQ